MWVSLKLQLKKNTPDRWSTRSKESFLCLWGELEWDPQKWLSPGVEQGVKSQQVST